jgi:lipoprotein-anchoring transpeptidase ErfK/SrfK
MRNKLLEAFLSVYLLLLMMILFVAAATPQVVVKIDLATQTAVVTSPEGIFATVVSTGRPGRETPKGVFHVYRRHRMWHSRKYGMTPMPYSLFFYKGFAMHTGDTRRPWASHGCVRLPNWAAKKLWMISQGRRVKVILK